MARTGRFLVLTFAMFCLVALGAFSQEAEEGGLKPEFGLDIGLGAATFNEEVSVGVTEEVTYQMLSLRPDFSIGPFGIGLDLTLHYRFISDAEGNRIDVRGEDWNYKEAGVGFLELYLPMLRYVRWGHRGDAIYAKFGSIDDATLGNGFIMGNYSNTLFLPDRRIFGLNFDLDGKLFKFPYVGFQSFVANIANFDIIGGRVFVRPLVWWQVPILQYLEFGGTLVADTDPNAYVPEGDELAGDPSVTVTGVDFRLPILSNPIISMMAFGDYVSERANDADALEADLPEAKSGGMIGVGGKLFKFMPYGAQIRFLGDDFIPVYFSEPYDTRRDQYYTVIANTATDPIIEGKAGWFATLGFAFLDDAISFNASLDGPFGKVVDEIEDPDQAWANYPHLRATFLVQEGLVPGLSLKATADRRNIQHPRDLIDFTEESTIGAELNYQTGPAIISLTYDVSYNPETEEWETSASLGTSLSLF